MWNQILQFLLKPNMTFSYVLDNHKFQISVSYVKA